MEVQLSVTSAVYVHRDPDLVRIQFNDGTQSSIYLNDGSPHGGTHALLEEWIAAGNSIEEPQF